MKKIIEYSFLILTFLITSCTKHNSPVLFIDSYENEKDVFNKKIHIDYRGKDKYGSNLFSYYLKINDSASMFCKVYYKKDSIRFIDLSSFERTIIDTNQIKREFDFLLRFNVRELSISQDDFVRVNLDQDDNFDLIKTPNKSDVEYLKEPEYTEIKKGWYHRND